MSELAILNDILLHLDNAIKTKSFHDVEQARVLVAKLIEAEPQDTKPWVPAVEPSRTTRKKVSKRRG